MVDPRKSDDEGEDGDEDAEDADLAEMLHSPKALGEEMDIRGAADCPRLLEDSTLAAAGDMERRHDTFLSGEGGLRAVGKDNSGEGGHGLLEDSKLAAAGDMERRHDNFLPGEGGLRAVGKDAADGGHGLLEDGKLAAAGDMERRHDHLRGDGTLKAVGTRPTRTATPELAPEKK